MSGAQKARIGAEAGSGPVPQADSESDALHRRQRGKNIALALALVAWVALIWVITMVNFDAGV